MATALVAATTLAARVVAVAADEPIVPEVSAIVSVDVSGQPADGREPAISDDGRYVAFSSEASNLVEGDTNGRRDILVRDRVRGSVERVNLSNYGTQMVPPFDGLPTSFAASAPSISGDGRYVAFIASAGNFGPPWDWRPHVYLRDRQLATTRMVDLTPDGSAADDEAQQVILSHNGRYALFSSGAHNLVVGEPAHSNRVIFKADLATGVVSRAGLTSAGGGPAYDFGVGDRPEGISDDGDTVLWESTSDYRDAPSYPSAFTDVLYVRTISTSNTMEVPGSTAENTFENDYATLTPDGRCVTYTSRMNLNGPYDGSYRVWRFDNTDHSYVLGVDPGTMFGVSGPPFYSPASGDYIVAGAGGVYEKDSSGFHLIGGSGPGDAAVASSSDGQHVAWTYWVWNGGWNVGVAAVDLTPPDSVPPVVSGSPDRPANGAGWYSGPVTVSWSSVDPAPSSGTPSMPAATVAATEGSQVLYTSAPSCDPAGNCATGSVSLSIDQTAPSVGVPAFSLSPKSVSDATTVTATATDALSGVVGGELFVGADPGVGRGTPMTWSGSLLSASIGSSLPPGVYTVGVRSEDAADNWSSTSSTSSAMLVVYDPLSGFATGGGWVVPGSKTSDPGDVLPGLDGTSKANFGFVVKYQNGASTVPGGNLQFDYNAGRFHLRSSAMNWLVVTNQNMAKFQGSASIDGITGSYPFQVDARGGDSVGQMDRFSIRIYAPGSDPNTANPVYKASGDVSGGQIVIHKS